MKDVSIDQVITLVEVFLDTTYFVCDGVFYHQIWGTRMVVLAISLSVMNLHCNGRFCGEGPRQCTDQATCLVPLTWRTHLGSSHTPAQDRNSHVRTSTYEGGCENGEESADN